jgi:hypothetical protein
MTFSVVGTIRYRLNATDMRTLTTSANGGRQTEEIGCAWRKR